MLITSYLIVMISLAVLPLVAVLAAPGVTPRPLRTVLWACLPLLGIGILCGLFLAANGQPHAEWIIPLIGMLAVGTLCRSDRLFNAARRWIPVGSFIAAWMFLYLVQFTGRYTANPVFSATVLSTQQHLTLKIAGDELIRLHSGAIFPSGRVSTILGNHIFDRVPAVRLFPLWHTPITRLHRVEQFHAAVWYPGGVTDTAARRLALH